MKSMTTTQARNFLKGLIITATAVFATAGCNQNLGHPTADVMVSGGSEYRASAAALGAVDFALVSKQVFQPHCLKCHSTDVAKGDVVLDVYNSAFLARAEVRKNVEKDAMPRKAAPLSPELKALLFAWIDAGAPEK
ncbi:hypothetical protein BH10BDE1_BH10BDE1_10280 [soil metagenome]